MEIFKINKSLSYSENLVWVGLIIGIFFWFAESALHVFVLHEGTFASQIFTRDFHEIWKRSFSLALIIVFSLYAQLRITEGKMKDEALREMERKYKTLFEEGLIPIFIFDLTGRFIDCNRAAIEFFECPQDQITGRSIWDYTVKKTSGCGDDFFFKLISRKSLEIDYELSGKIKTLMINLVPYNDSENRIIYGIGQDITKRKKVEQQIRIAHTELNQIFQTASVGMRLIDKECNVLKVNETFSALSGVSAENAVGKKCYSVFKGGNCHTDSCSLKRILNGEHDIEIEIEKNRKDGTIVSCLLTARPFYDVNGELKGIVESFKNIDELKRIQENLRTEHDKLSRILFQRLEGVGIINSDFTIEFLNDALQGQFGDCRGGKCHVVFRERDYPCEACIMHKAFISGKLRRYEFNSSDGRIYEQTYTPFLDTDSQEKVVMAIRDVTEVKTAKAVAYRAEQLAALGELAAGVAHEINNPINGIINYAQILVNKNEHNPEINGIANRIRKESNRVARIVENLLSFSRRERQSKVPVNIEEILDEALALINSQMKRESIIINKNRPSNLPQILAVPQEIQQVFINILSNARYSLNKKYPGNGHDKIIQIESGTIENEKTSFVRVSFLDHGIGIPPDIINKVIHPFFSTKPRGCGTGLGLSISLGIINEHGGKMVINSRENEYTRVTIDLPSVDFKMTGFT